MGQHLNRTFPRHMPARQRGVVLFIALIALVAMTLAGIALMRSVDTANVIAGNFAFKESTLHASDFGTEIAYNELANIVPTGKDTRTPSAAHPYYYFPVLQTLNPNGVPTGNANVTVNWDNSSFGYKAGPNNSIPNGYTVQYVIERECTATQGQTQDGTAAGPDPASASYAADVAGYCITAPVPGGSGGSKNSDAVSFAKSGLIYYRVTIRVKGPHNAISMVQSSIML